MPPSLRIVSLLLPTSIIAALGCTDATYGVPDLPDDWQGATHVDRLTQSACGSDPTQGLPEAINLSTDAGTIEVAYAHAPFRCTQDVEAYLRKQQDTLDVLVQPVNLNPPVIARCSCQYDLSLVLPALKREHLAAGHYQVNVFRRADHIGDESSEPVAVGTGTVDVK